MFKYLLSLALLVLTANKILSQPLPDETKTEKGSNNEFSQLENINDNIFKLIVPDSKGKLHEEVVEQIAPDYFIAKDGFKPHVSGPGARLIITYKTGPNSYWTRYNFVSQHN